jgi:ribosomal protein S18 acetylase RimI-like enzyme
VTSGETTPAVRPATLADASRVAEIWRSGWRDGHIGNVPQQLVDARTDESFDIRAAERVGDTSVAVIGEAIAGFTMVVDDEVEQVYVSQDHRGSGVADALLSEAERQIRAGGHDAAWLAVVAGNARARRFYERCGWVDEGEFVYEASDRTGPIAVPCRRYVKALD